MHDDQLEQAVLTAAIDGAPAKLWHVPEAEVQFSTTTQGHPFDGLLIYGWVK